MKKTIFAVAVLAALAANARAQPYGKVLDQELLVSSVTVQSVTIGTTFTQVDTPKLEGSFLVEVQNLSTEQICCSFDSGASSSSGSGRACVRIDTAATASRATATDWKRWKRWASALSLWCKTLKAANGSTAEVIVTQGR